MGQSQEPSGPHYSTIPKDTEARIPPGTVVAGGRIEIVGELARGGMAIVYRARDLGRQGAEVAFKVVTEQADRADTEARYRNEARLGSSLATDPRFVRPLGVGCLEGPEGFEGRMFLITELVAGESLAEVMFANARGVAIDRVRSIGVGVAKALVSLHERGIVHRDIKPGNVLVEQHDGVERVRLIDFGLAYATGDGWEPKSEDLTRDGQAPGTPLYMSPQQAVHERPAPSFDVYSFGALLYELISGTPPHEGLPLQMLIAEKCDPQSQPFPIGKMCPGTPVEIAELVGRCMSYDPLERPTAGEIVEVLEPSATRPAAAPELRVVPAEGPVAAAEAPSVAAKGPSTVAEGARPAGDETRVDILRKRLQLPSVKKQAAALAEVAEVREWTETDEVTAVARPAVVPMEGAATSVVDVPKPTVAATAAAPARPESDTSPRRPWLLVIPLLILCAGGVAYALRPAAGGPNETETPAKGATAVEAGLSGRSDAAPSAAEAKAASPSPRDDIDPPPASVEPATPQPPIPPEPTAPTPPRDVQPVAPEPTKPKPTPPPKKAAAPKKPAPTPVTCDDHRSQANAAKAKKKWAAVLAETKDASCWTSAGTKRERLRVEALMELGRFKACNRAAFTSKDAQVIAWGKECYRRAEANADSRKNE